MPFVNLAVAQAAAAWIAAPNLVGMIMEGGPLYAYAVAAVGAVIVLVGAFIGARITRTIAPPTLLSAVAAVSFAIIAAASTPAVLGGGEALSDLVTQGLASVPVAAAIAGYFFASRRRAAA
jgi:hypothetical protein